MAGRERRKGGIVICVVLPLMTLKIIAATVPGMLFIVDLVPCLAVKKKTHLVT